MKVAISIADDLFLQAEDLAARLGVNRSQLYARALERLLESQGPDPVTMKLNELAEELGQRSGAAAGRRLIDQGLWDW